MKNDIGTLKFNCEKVIRQLTATYPELVYPYFNKFAELLISPNNIIQWGTIISLSNLIEVDRDNNFEAIYELYFGLLNAESMITASNVVKNAWKYVQAHPEKEGDLTARLLNVRENNYMNKGKPSPECKNILIGAVINCLDHYYDMAHD